MTRGALGGTTDFLAESSDHRYGEQLRFIARFPAYTTIEYQDAVTWWYREGEEPAFVRFTWDGANQGLKLHGDVTMGQWVMRRDAIPLPDRTYVEALPTAHRRLFDQCGGVRPPVYAEPFEGVSWAILGQQITVGFAAQLKERVAARYGTIVDQESGLFVFPSAATMSRASIDDLRALKLSRQKAETLIRVAQAVEEGIWDWHRLYTMPSQDAFEMLVQMKGIGPWTADYCLLRVFGHPDILPTGDVALRRAWGRITGNPLVSEADLRQAGDVWKGCRSDFAFWLWLDNFQRRSTQK